MISRIAGGFTFSSALPIIALIAGVMPTLKIAAIVLVVLWLALFLVSEIGDAIQNQDRQAL